MATFICIHGAGGWGSYWDLVAAELTPLGHEVIGVDLPCDQEVGLAAYRDAVVAAIGDRRDDLVLVAQSLGGLIAPLVAGAVPVDLIVLVTAMIPDLEDPDGPWWTMPGHAEALAAQHLPDDSEATLFTHDVPAEVLAGFPPPRDQMSTLFDETYPLTTWPDVPTRFLVCRDDRYFPAAWMRGVVRDRLGIEPDEVPGSHCAFFSRPVELVAAIARCWTETGGDGSVLTDPHPVAA